MEIWTQDLFGIQKQKQKIHPTKNDLWEPRHFLCVTKVGITFVIHGNPSLESTKTTISIREQYNEFQNVFRKKNANVLLEL